jgi:hypothetical protein
MVQDLHWKIENHKRITLEILDKMKRIQKNGIEIKIHWTPGHANVNGNLQTGCFSSVVSSSTNTIAPAPHGPGLLRHEPLVNAIAVFSIRIYRSTRNKKKNRTTYNIFGQSNSNWNTYPTLEN